MDASAITKRIRAAAGALKLAGAHKAPYRAIPAARKKLKSKRQFIPGKQYTFRGRSEVYIADKNGSLRRMQ